MHEKTEEFLPVKLTDEEFYERSTELAEVDQKIEDAEEEKRSLSQAIKNRVGGLITRKVQLRTIVRERQEFRHVECEWIPHFPSKQVSLVRMDTGETVRTRTMKVEELQEKLNLTDEEMEAYEKKEKN